MPDLLLMNLPYNASDREIRKWIESRGIETKSIRIIRELATSVSPAFGHVVLKGNIELEEAIFILDGKKMRNQTVLAREVPDRGQGLLTVTRSEGFNANALGARRQQDQLGGIDPVLSDQNGGTSP